MDSRDSYDATTDALDLTDWADMSGSAHFVEFYDDEQKIVEAVAGYFVHGLRFGETCIIAATGERYRLIEKRMRDMYRHLDAALYDQKFIVLDARDTLDRFMVNSAPDPELFDRVIGGSIRKAAESNKRIRVFGEMVAVLTEDGNAAGALQLEHLWNALAQKLSFRLFCAYPDKVLTSPDLTPYSADICSSHSHVLGQNALVAA